MRIHWIGLVHLITMASFRCDANDAEADPDRCRLSWLPLCPDKILIHGFDDKLGNFSKSDFKFHSDLVIEPIECRTLNPIICRNFLRCLFVSLAAATSNITTKTHEIVFNPLSAQFVHEWDQTFLRLRKITDRMQPRCRRTVSDCRARYSVVRQCSEHGRSASKAPPPAPLSRWPLRARLCARRYPRRKPC